MTDIENQSAADATQYGSFAQWRDALRTQPLLVRVAIRRQKPRPWWRDGTRDRGSLRLALAFRRDYILGARGRPLS
jgi:hypothetical protein